MTLSVISTPHKVIRKNAPILAVLIGAFFISFSGVWVKFAHVTPVVSAFYRVFLGFLFLLAASLCKHDFKRLTALQIFLVTCCGLFFAMDLFCWHGSILYIGPGLATIMGNFQVFFLSLAGVLFFKERLRLNFLLSIPLAFLGLLLIIGWDWNTLGTNYRTGLYLGLATAVCYSCFLLTLRRLQAEKGAFSIFFFLMLVSLASSVFLALEIFITHNSFVIPDLTSWISLISLGLFSQTIGWVLIANALPKIQASYVGLVLLLQPALAFIWDVLIFSRKTDATNWFGTVVVLAAIYMGMSHAIKKE
jgi:drug/metabolite transporter (DMT)-like permease